MTDSANSTSTIFNNGPHTANSEGPVNQRTTISTRAPIQVTLEDNLRTQYKPQVKILRRPRPADQTSDIDNNSKTTFNGVANNNTAIPSIGHNKGPDLSFAAVAATTNDVKTTTTTYSNVLIRNNNNINNNNISNNNSSSSSSSNIRLMTDNSRGTGHGSLNTNDARTVINNSNKTMRTYQERADEYAKARLRILGSAFPIDDADNNVQ